MRAPAGVANPLRRNVAISAHADQGRTTLVDALPHQSDLLTEHERVAERILDDNHPRSRARHHHHGQEYGPPLPRPDHQRRRHASHADIGVKIDRPDARSAGTPVYAVRLRKRIPITGRHPKRET